MLVGDHGDFTCFFIVMFGSEHIFTLRLLVSVRIYLATVGFARIYLAMVKVGQDLHCDSWSD